ncbi:ABC transporter permease subunit [Paenibacillus sp. LMG 31458]|uniref:ABC transporter permease subunit n=1 Tax=Paenibacillus phytorum TaxID=2654977 RepID=A0ABX1YAS5_9BACL|nr:sugar ABC transporter permease [Paenibacillus phytorum]NOU77030.1 ABC transporter permease subunit [Paenibacillus phytorum]
MNLKRIYPQYLTFLPLGIYLLFFIVPSLVGFYFAFTDWNPFIEGIHFVGFANFAEILNNKSLGGAAWNTISFTIITTILKNGFGLLIAIILNQQLKSQNLLRTIYFLPIILSALVVGLLFNAIFDAQGGVIHRLATQIGLEAWEPEWLGRRLPALFVINLAEIWRSTGYAVVILLAGLQVIPKDYYEAAMIDGASAWQRFKSVTIPLLMPAIHINILLSIIYGLRVFDIVYILTGGGPGHDTETFSTLILNEFSQDRYAQSTAINLVFCILLVGIAFTYQKFSQKTEVEL